MPKKPGPGARARYREKLKVSAATQKEIRRRAIQCGYRYWTGYASEAALNAIRMRAKQLGVTMGAAMTAVVNAGERHVTTSQIVAAQSRWYADVWERRRVAPAWPGHPYRPGIRGPTGVFQKLPRTEATG